MAEVELRGCQYYSDDNTTYDLTLTETPEPESPGRTDNDLNVARELGTLRRTRILHDFVGTSDTRDYYRFDLAGSVSEVTLRLDGLSDHARVDLIEDANGNGIVDSGEVLGSSFGYPGRAASIMRWLDSGVWYLRAYPNNP